MISMLSNPLAGRTAVPEAAMSRRAPQDMAKASAEFEAILLNQVLTKLRETFSMQSEAGGDPGANTLNGVANQTLCNALAAHGGFGLAAMIRRAGAEK